MQQNIFIQEKQPLFYIYRQMSREFECVGIIGCASIDDYLNNIIKRHEHTLVEKEKKLKEYLDIVDIHAEPVLMFHPDSNEINEILFEISNLSPLYDFTTTDTIRHTLWSVPDKFIEDIQSIFKKFPSIYIADGHHRSAASVLYGLEKRHSNPHHTGNELYNFFLCYFLQERYLKVWEFNRIIKNTSLPSNQILEKLHQFFICNKISRPNTPPSANHIFYLYISGQWFSCELKPEYTSILQPPYETLSSVIIDKYFFEPILDIYDLRNNPNVSFVSGKEGIIHFEKETNKYHNSLGVVMHPSSIEEIKAKYFFEPILDIYDLRNNPNVSFVSGKEGIIHFEKETNKYHNSLGVVMHPSSIEEIKAIADNNLVMPPKSTWIEPKLRSGLTIYRLH
ncbi:MAG: chromosome partitioning protein ParB [Vicingaceae bacterium]|nr:MAG: chromosome partitioning protein ParB [Vicingaceae bacterium]